MRKLLPILLASVVFLTAGVALGQDVPSSDASSTAGNLPQIAFPISELGNCASKDKCRMYCEGSTHTDACLSFAQTHGLMKSDDIQKARTFLTLKGPGGCTGEACKAYCAEVAHADECLAFAKTNHLISATDAKIADDIKTIGGPGGCRSAVECRAFCSDIANRDTCIQFAKAHDLTPSSNMQTKDASSTVQGNNNAKIAVLLAKTPGPGGCTALETCKLYCSDSAHLAECIQFAKDNGLMTGAEVNQARKLLTPGPGGCVGETCKQYCDDASHLDECRVFAVQNGFTFKDTSAQFEDGSSSRMGQPSGTPGMKPGPGGCKDRAECEAFCKVNPDQCRQLGGQQSTTSQPQSDTQALIKEKCSEYGGTWDGQHCIKRSSDGTLQPPQPAADEIQKRCESLGGSWDGIHCTRPNIEDGVLPTKPLFPISTQPEPAGPSSMTPLSVFTASVFTIFQGLLK